MKKFFIVMTLIGLLSFAWASNIDDAVNWMYQNGLTIHDNSISFKPNKSIRRDEAAKFFVEFAKLIWKTNYVKNDNECNFQDINKSWSKLKDYVVRSCKLWLIGPIQSISHTISIGNWWIAWIKKNDIKNFSPARELRNATAVTVLVRLIDGNKVETWFNNWTDYYYLKANELNILKGVNMKEREGFTTRWNLAKIIYNASKLYNIDQLTGKKTSKVITKTYEISKYKDITKAWNYILKNDLNLWKNILSIKANDVTLDCWWFKIFSDWYDLVYLYWNNITIKNCTLEHTNGGTSCIHNRWSWKKIKIENNKFLNCGGIAILFNNLSNWLINWNEIIGNWRAGNIWWSPTQTCMIFRNTINSTIQDNITNNCGLWLKLEKSSGNKFLRNEFKNSMWWIDAWGINNNNFEYNTISTKKIWWWPAYRNAFYINNTANIFNKSTCKNNKLIGNEMTGPVNLEKCAEIID